MNKKEFNLSNFSLFISSFLLFTTAVFVYGFFGLLLEAIAYVSYGIYDKSLFFTGTERIYFNVFLAGLSLLFGFQGSLQFLLSRIDMKSYESNRIKHKGRLLIWIALFLLIKFYAIVLFNNALFFAPLTTSIPFSLLCLIMLLILVTLFFYAWSSINRIVFNGKPKAVYYGVLVFLTLSVSLAQVEMIDISGLRSQILNQNVVYTHQVEYPKSEISRPIKKRVLVCDFVIAKNSSTNAVELYYENTIIPLNTLESTLGELRDQYRDEDMYKLKPGLRIDKTILLKDLLPIFEVFFTNHMNTFVIYIDNKGLKTNQVLSYRFDPSILYDFLKSQSKRLVYPEPLLGTRMPPHLIEGYFPTKGGKDIFCSKTGVFMDDDTFTIEAFKGILDGKSTDFYKKVIHHYFVDTHITFGQYIHTKSKLFKTYDLLRNDYALKTYNKPFNLLSKEQSKEVRKLYPINIKEFGLNKLDDGSMNIFFKEQDGYFPLHY